MLAAIIYGLSTPVGIAVGLALRGGYDPGSPTASIVSGVLDALSAGILIYTGLVEVGFFLRRIIFLSADDGCDTAPSARVPLQQGDDAQLEWAARLCARDDAARVRGHGAAGEVGVGVLSVSRVWA